MSIKSSIFNKIKPVNLPPESITVIEPGSGWQFVDFRELREYRDLFYFLVWRDIKILYAQTILGFAWAILQPLAQIIIFTVIFGKVAQVSSDGIPYLLFCTVAIIPWTYMSQAMKFSSESLITAQHMLSKIYFPRLIFPIVPILAKFVDFAISMLIIFILCLYYHVLPTWNLVLLPFFVILMMSVSTAAGMWLSALAVRFRDVKHAMQFVLRMLMFTAPIVYSATSIPMKYRVIYSLNPIVSVIEGFRACILGIPIPWIFIWPGTITAAALLIGGVFYFKRMERFFVDVL